MELLKASELLTHQAYFEYLLDGYKATLTDDVPDNVFGALFEDWSTWPGQQFQEDESSDGEDSNYNYYDHSSDGSFPSDCYCNSSDSCIYCSYGYRSGFSAGEWESFDPDD